MEGGGDGAVDVINLLAAEAKCINKNYLQAS